MKTLAFFNNKGGVGKTSLVYHLSWMFAEMGVDVVAIDLDPQSNLTSSFLEDDQLIELWDAGPSSRTIRGLIQPLLDRLGDIGPSDPIEIDRRIGLIPGDLGLSLFEDRLAETWGRCFDDNTANASDAFRVTTAFYRIMEHGREAAGCRPRPDRCRPQSWGHQSCCPRLGRSCRNPAGCRPVLAPGTSQPRPDSSFLAHGLGGSQEAPNSQAAEAAISRSPRER